MAKSRSLSCLSIKYRSVIAAILFFVSNSVYSVTTDQLRDLDKIKTQNFSQFSAELDLLVSSKDEMGKDESQYLKFLLIYRKVYLNDYDGVVSDIEHLFSQELSSELRFRLAALSVNALNLKREYKQAFLYADTVLKSISDIDDVFTLKQVLAPMAMLFIDAQQKDLARFYIEQLRMLPESENNSCFADYLTIRLNMQGTDVDIFTESASAAVNSCSNASEELWRDLSYLLWTKKLLENGLLDEAKILIDMFSDRALKSTYTLLSAATYGVNAEYELQKGNYAESQKLIKLALTKTERNDTNEVLIWIYFTAYKLAVVRNDYKNALENFQKYNELSQRLEKEKADKQLAFELSKSEIAVKNQQIELLNKDNELLFLQTNVYEQEVKQTRVLLGILGLMLFVSIVLAYKGISGRRRFKKIAEYDQLTGISNRYHFNNQAWVALNYCEKNNKPASVILFDLDYFKSINDMHGHSVGDWALQAVVKTCRNFMRNNDVFGRIGGEEFAVVLPGCQTDKAILLAEICRDAISAIDSSESGKKFPLSASFGVAGSDSSGYQLKQLLADADHAMYKAKAAGRDTVASFVEES